MNLKAIRKARLLSQNAIAERTGLSQSLISRIERDSIDPPLSTLRSLSAVLGCTVGELIGECRREGNDGR